MDYETFKQLRQCVGAEVDDWRAAYSMVRMHTIKPEDADALCASQGWPPFSIEPPAPNPDDLVFWPLPMVVEWIAYGRITKENVPGWCAGRIKWIYDKRAGGWTLINQPMPTLWRLKMQADRDARNGAPPRVSIEAAEQTILNACRQGKLEITALAPRDGERTAPTRIQWQDIDFIERDGVDVLRDRNGMGWREPTAEAEAVMTLWPAEEETEAAEDEPETLPVIEAWPEVEDKADGTVAPYAEAKSVIDHWRMEGADERPPNSVASAHSALSLHEAELFLSTDSPPEPREAARRFTDARNGKRLSEARDLCAQILIRHFEDRLGGVGRKLAPRENAVSDWFSARRKRKEGAPITEPGDFKSLVRHTDEAFFKLLK